MASTEQRRKRVLQGSRRRRDLAAAGLTDHADREASTRNAEAHAQREREVRLRPQIQPSPAADSAWTTVHDALRGSVSASKFALWLEPLACIGEVSGALAVEVSEHTFAWTFRRYGALLGECARGASDYRGVFLFRAQPSDPSDDEGLL